VTLALAVKLVGHPVAGVRAEFAAADTTVTVDEASRPHALVNSTVLEDSLAVTVLMPVQNCSTISVILVALVGDSFQG